MKAIKREITNRGIVGINALYLLCRVRNILWLVGIILSGHFPAAFAQEATSIRPDVPLSMTLDIRPDGAAGPMWIDALRVFHEEKALDEVLADRHPLSEVEAGWVDLILGRAASWSGRTGVLQIPFEPITPPDTVYIVLGNVGGQDAFTYSDTTIAFDVQRLGSLYGEALKAENGDRIDRFFAHEFTHILHKAWRKAHDPALDTPLDRALWDCLVEGIGNYRSLSARWVDSTGVLTPHAREVLARLQVTFVDRIAALAHATDAEEDTLIEGLSMGPFDQKWGALTVALWFAQEAGGNDLLLQKWVEAGPQGVLDLARVYLPADLEDRLPPHH